MLLFPNALPESRFPSEYLIRSQRPLAMYRNWTNSLVFFLAAPSVRCLESRPQLFVAARLDQTVLAQGNSQVPYTNPQRNPYRLAKLCASNAASNHSSIL